MKLKDIEPLLWGAVNIYGNSAGCPLLVEGWNTIPDELLDHKVIEISSGYEWPDSDPDRPNSFVEITIEE